MKKDKKTTESNLFPDYSYFERAINYPYPTPDYAYSFFKGKFIQGNFINGKTNPNTKIIIDKKIVKVYKGG